MRYIVVGASAAGISGAKTLRELDKDAEIILVSKDENVYSRCILHHYISGHRDIEALDFTDRDFFEKYNIEWKKGLEVKAIDDRDVELLSDDNGHNKYNVIIIEHFRLLQSRHTTYKSMSQELYKYCVQYLHDMAKKYGYVIIVGMHINNAEEWLNNWMKKI